MTGARRFSLLLCVVVACLFGTVPFQSCTKEASGLTDGSLTVVRGDRVECSFSSSVEDMENALVTKSSFSNSFESAQNRAVFVVCEDNGDSSGGIVAVWNSDDSASCSLEKNVDYNVHAYVNFPSDFEEELNMLAGEDELPGLTYQFTKAQLSSNGMPMYGKLESFRPGVDEAVVPVKRLMAKVTVNITCNWNGASIQGVSLYNANKSINPFSNAVLSGSGISVFDSFTVSGGGSTASGVLYVPENMQGTISGISNSSSKSPDFNSTVSSRQSCLTYIETEVNGNGTYQGVVRYRSYLGNNATNNFDIKRNVAYVWNLTFTESGLQYDDWKHETDELYKYRYRYDVTPTSLAVNVGGSASFQVRRYTDTWCGGVWSNGTTPTVLSPSSQYTFSVVSSTVARANASGNNVSVTGLASGNTNINVVISDGLSNGTPLSVPVTVSDSITFGYRLTLDPATCSINVGESVSFTPYLHTDRYSNGVLMESDYLVEAKDPANLDWLPSNTSVLGYSGTTGTFNGVSAGTSTLTAYYNSGNHGVPSSPAIYVEATSTVTVVNNVMYELVVTSLSGATTAHVSEDIALLAKFYTTTNGVRDSGVDVSLDANTTWRAVSVTGGLYLGSNSSSSTKGVVYASSPGKGTFEAGYVYNGATYWGQSPELTFIADDITYSYGNDLAVTPANASIYIGDTQAYTATITRYTYTNGVLSNTESGYDVTSSCSWSTGNSSIATISSGGVATGVLNGTTTVNATFNGKNASTNLTVLQSGPSTRYYYYLTLSISGPDSTYPNYYYVGETSNVATVQLWRRTQESYDDLTWTNVSGSDYLVKTLTTSEYTINITDGTVASYLGNGRIRADYAGTSRDGMTTSLHAVYTGSAYSNPNSSSIRSADQSIHVFREAGGNGSDDRD